MNNIFVPSARLLSVENSGGKTEISNKFCMELLVLTVFHVYLIYRISLMTIREGSFRLCKIIIARSHKENVRGVN